MALKRGGTVQILGLTSFRIVDELPLGSKVMAHCGYWNVDGAAQNSVASLKNAIENGCYVSECDIWLIDDYSEANNAIMFNHDSTFNGVKLKISPYDRCKELKLSNGKKMPRHEYFLESIKADNVDFITTNNPVEAARIEKYYSGLHKSRAFICIKKTASFKERCGLFLFSQMRKNPSYLLP